MVQTSYILALDTAMQGCSAAVLNTRTGAYAARSETMGRGQSERLVPMVEEVLAEAGIAYADLSLVAVTVGPGAFTGLRIGLSAARAFATALNIPVAGVTTTGVFARQYADAASSPFAVILETKRSDFYIQLFDEKGKALEAPDALDAEAIKARLKSGMTIIGDGAARFNEMTGGAFAGAVVGGYDLPDPRTIATIGLEQLESGTVASADPVYLREADVSRPKNTPRSIAGE
jgi:tRNA threonylcarbamoyladenosine biosynthesis protein TsaB